MNKQLNARQICLFFIAFLPVVKLLTLPSLLAEYANEDMWISALFSFFIDTLVLICLLFISFNTDDDFYTILSAHFGKNIANIIYILFVIYFILKSIIPINEQRTFIDLTLYITKPSPLYFIPFFIIAFYLSTKKLRILGRLADILFLVAITGIIFIIVLCLGNSDFESLLPIGANGFKKILSASFKTSNWFGDSIYFLFFLGNFKKEKKYSVKILLSYILSCIIALLFIIIFYCVFTYIAFRTPFALTDIAKYSTVINNTARFDYLAITMIMFVDIIGISLPLFFASKLLDTVFRFHSIYISPLIITLLSIIPHLIFSEKFYLIEYFSSNYMGILNILFIIILPIITLFLTLKRRRKCDLLKQK